VLDRNERHRVHQQIILTSHEEGDLDHLRERPGPGPAGALAKAPREALSEGCYSEGKLRLQMHMCGFHLLLRPILASNCLRDGKEAARKRGGKLPAVLEVNGCRVPLRRATATRRE
jgi:hypothetical protein